MRDFFFADDAAVTAHSVEDLQQLMNRFSKVCQDIETTISLRKKYIYMGQEVDSSSGITISDHELKVVDDFAYLCSTYSDTLL